MDLEIGDNREGIRMRAYGTIKSDLKEIEESLGIETRYSVDSLVFETKEGKEFYIDFDEADYSKDKECLAFRLKGMGVTFHEHWVDLERNELVEIEQDHELFNTCKLKGINLYLDSKEDSKTLDIINTVSFELLELQLTIGEKTVEFKVEDTTIQLN